VILRNARCNDEIYVEDSLIGINWWDKAAYCWSVTRICITMRGSENVKITYLHTIFKLCYVTVSCGWFPVAMPRAHSAVLSIAGVNSVTKRVDDFIPSVNHRSALSVEDFVFCYRTLIVNLRTSCSFPVDVVLLNGSVVPLRENCFILFHFIIYNSYMLLALWGTAGYISQSNKQESHITCHSHSSRKPVEIAENCC